MNKHWIYVFFAGMIEIIWAIELKYSRNIFGGIIVIVLIGISFWLLFEATKKIPVSTVYAVFTGIGTLGTSISGMLFFHETFSWNKVCFILLLLSGVVGLKIITPKTEEKDGDN